MTSVNTTFRLKMLANSGLLHTKSLKSIAAKNLRTGKKDLKSMNKSSCTAIIIQLIALFGVFSLPPLLLAQGLSLEERVESASNALAELDRQASACLDSIDKKDDDNLLYCDDFIKALDGELIGNYLNQCEVLKAWRDDFVEDQSTPTDDIERILELMTGIEFSCGEDALLKRTQYVAKTFGLLQDTGRASQSAVPVNRRISELQVQRMQNAERLSLQNSILQQNRRLQLETDQRQDDLEKELLRQQINSAPFPGN